MSTVYKAVDTLAEQAGIEEPYVAIKLLQPKLANQAEAREALISEARKTQQLSHPNIIRIYEFGFESGKCFIVMEWLDGETLEQVISRSRPTGLPYKKLKGLLTQLIDGLDYAHKQGVIHADLKPANIMLTRQGQIKIFDFGVAQAIKELNDKFAVVTTQPKEQLTGYTPTYASLNQITGGSPRANDDAFSFCQIAYELACSKHPFDRQPADVAKKKQLVARKPGSMPWWQWLLLKRGLALDSSADFSWSGMRKRLNKRLAPALLTLTIGCVVALFAAQYINGIHHENTLLNTHLEQMKARQLSHQEMMHLDAKSLIQLLPSIPEHEHLLLNGLLRIHQTSVLRFYEGRIDSILNNRSATYPDYYAIEAELNAAKNLYPDSNVLSRLDVDLLQRWRGTVEVLDQRLNELLEKGLYQTDEETSELFELLNELTLIKHDYRPLPTIAAENLFKKRFNDALKNHKVGDLKQLISVGEKVFKDSDELSTLIAQGELLKNAVADVAHYQHQIGLGNDPSYPYESAQVFYQSAFDGFHNRLQRADTVKKMDRINKEVDALANDLPGDFSPLLDIRRSLANRYLSFSKSFLKQRKVRSAQRQMEKADKLFALMDTAHAKI
ncbi:serine/threonine-protein kinase [Corallincola platygyrae]